MDNKMLGICTDFHQTSLPMTERQVGEMVLSLLNKFQEYGDMNLNDFFSLKHMEWDEYDKISASEIRSYFKVKDSKEMMKEYRECGIKYILESHKYEFFLSWMESKGNRYNFDSAPSTGKPGLLTFDTPLEFDDTIEPEALGRMVLEAFDRCEQLADMAAGNKIPAKEITLLDESVIEVQMPKDKHFADAEDMGVGEIYQAYEYLPNEDAESSANFYLGIGAELNCDVSAENIRATWERYYGIAETFEVEEVNCGIYTLRAELRNKKFHRISYFLPQSETLLLECAMELFQPGKRKKLDERLTELFEDFAGRCKRK